MENFEEEEENLIEEERMLTEELNLIQEKHKDVRLVYEKVTENIKNVTKSDPKKFDDNSGFIFNNSDFLNDNSHLDSSENYIKSNFYEDELIRLHKEYLESIKKNYQTNFMNKEKADLILMMKERKGTTESNNSLIKCKKEKPKVASKRILNEKNTKGNVKDTHSSTRVSGYNEYVYSDEENIEDDKKMKEEYDQIVNQFKKKVIYLVDFLGKTKIVGYE